MLKTYLSFLITGLLLLGPTAQMAAANQSRDEQSTTVATIKGKVGRLGVGEKARATITLNDGTKTKGYVARAGEEDFVLRDSITDNATTIRYADVARVDGQKGHSTTKNLAIGAAVGVGAVIGLIVLLFYGRARG